LNKIKVLSGKQNIWESTGEKNEESGRKVANIVVVVVTARKCLQ
jgi:hypothetical protein